MQGVGKRAKPLIASETFNNKMERRHVTIPILKRNYLDDQMKSRVMDDSREACKIKTFFKPYLHNDNLPPPSGAAISPHYIDLPGSGCHLLYAEHLETVAGEWRQTAPADNLFLSADYLTVLERTPPDGMTFGYLLICRGRKVLGGAALQFVDFNAGRHIRERRSGQAFSSLKERFKNFLAHRLRFRVMICGNALLTGEHGFFFREQHADNMALLRQALEAVAFFSQGRRREVQAIMIKELEEKKEGTPRLRHDGYHQLLFQPNMVMEIPPEWKSFDDYLGSLSSKYRVRARRAFKKARPVERRELTLPEIEKQQSLLHRFYLDIAERADFNMVQLSPGYLPGLKKAFPGRFHLYGYFRNGELIGYYTTIRNGGVLEAHFLGFRQAENYRYQLYLNMLYEIIGEAIEVGASRIVFARTALEIKSSVGATPREMVVFLKSTMGWFNPFVPGLVRLLEPREEWKPRHPFKE